MDKATEMLDLYRQTLPTDLKETIKCSVCGQDKHLLRLNDYIVFYIHLGDELKTCKYLGFRTSFMKDVGRLMYERIKLGQMGKGVE